jgi:hypothetical protein
MAQFIIHQPMPLNGRGPFRRRKRLLSLFK